MCSSRVPQVEAEQKIVRIGENIFQLSLAIRIWPGRRRYDWQLSRYLINRLFDRSQLGGNGPFNPFVIRDLTAKGDLNIYLIDSLMQKRCDEGEQLGCRACNLNLINFLAVAGVN